MLLPAVDALVDDWDGDVASPELRVHHIAFSHRQLLGTIARRTVCRRLAILEVKNITEHSLVAQLNTSHQTKQHNSA